jgi:hypothetical protein
MPPSATPASRSAPPKASMPPPAQAMNSAPGNGPIPGMLTITVTTPPCSVRISAELGQARAVKTDRLPHRVLCPSEAISS